MELSTDFSLFKNLFPFSLFFLSPSQPPPALAHSALG